jgi:hypothetical protein
MKCSKLVIIIYYSLAELKQPYVILSWIDGCNRADLTNYMHLITLKEVFQDSTFQQLDNNGKLVREIFLTKPIEVLFEGVNTNIYTI